MAAASGACIPQLSGKYTVKRGVHTAVRRRRRRRMRTRTGTERAVLSSGGLTPSRWTLTHFTDEETER